MKKVMLLSALCALALISCSKDDENNGTSFGKAEIRFELTGPDYQGVPSNDILEYFSITVSGTDFEGNTVSYDLCTGSHDAVITCTKAPTEDKSVFAELGLNVTEKKQLSDEVNYSADYSLRVTWAIYDKNGKEMSDGFVTRTSSSGSLSGREIRNELASNFMHNKFELCYVYMPFDDEWNYNIAWKQTGPQ